MVKVNIFILAEDKLVAKLKNFMSRGHHKIIKLQKQ